MEEGPLIYDIPWASSVRAADGARAVPVEQRRRDATSAGSVGEASWGFMPLAMGSWGAISMENRRPIKEEGRKRDRL